MKFNRQHSGRERQNQNQTDYDALAAMTRQDKQQNNYQLPTDDQPEVSPYAYQLQQSQQVQITTASQETPTQIQHQNQTANPPIPKPKNAIRPSTQQNSIKNDSIKTNQAATYSPQVQLQNYSTGIIRSTSQQQRPQMNQAFMPSNFSHTGYEQQMMNSSLNYPTQKTTFDRPPINNNYMTQKQQFSLEKDPKQRRQIITQILKMQNNSQTEIQTSHLQLEGSPIKNSNVRDASNGSVVNMKRNKIKQLLQVNRTNYGLNVVEKEELQQEKRNLKLQMNVMKDENTRLKTKLQIFQQELQKKDRDIEQLTLKMQQNFGQTQVKDNNIFESFLVSQLKKQIRDMKQESDTKDQNIEKLKKDIKLSKVNEIEIEMQQYIDECARLRGMLEQFMLQANHFQHAQLQNQAQVQGPDNNNYVIKEQTRIEDAFYEKEVQLQQAEEIRSQLETQLKQEKEARERVEKKWSIAEVRLKKFNEVINENKRKQVIINDRNNELTKLRDEVEQLREKARDRDQINNKNKELITKYYGQQSMVDYKEKRIQELTKQVQELQDQLRGQQKQPQQAAKLQYVTHSQPIESKKAADLSKTVGQAAPLYSQIQIELLFRAIKGQTLILSNDSMALKNYYNSHKTDITKEVEHLRKLNLKDKVKENLQSRRIVIMEVEKIKSYQELEKFIDTKLYVQDKDEKKYLIYMILNNSKQLNDLQLNELLKLIPHQESVNQGIHNKDQNSLSQNQDFQNFDSVNTVRVNQSIGDTTAQFIPPGTANQTPMTENKHSPNNFKKQKTTKNGKQGKQSQEDSYIDEEFEKVTSNDNSQNNGYLQDYQNNSAKKKNNHKQPQQHHQQQQETVQEEDYHNGDDPEESIQITEDQMLSIAEHVFQIIADKLQQTKVSIQKAFGKNCSVLDHFEGEDNVIIIQAKDFLEDLRNIGIKELSELEIACLMRVLSKPEIDHAIVFSELNLVLENFGIAPPDDSDKEQLKQKAEDKKKKLTKKKQIKALINSQEGQELYEILNSILNMLDYNIDYLMNLLKEKQYTQTVKTKKKETKVEIVNKDDFITTIKDKTKINLSNHSSQIEKIQSMLCIDNKYSEIFMVKSIQNLFMEVLQKYKQEEKEQKILAEFYQPATNDDNKNGSSSSQNDSKKNILKIEQQQQQPKQEVLNFEQFVDEQEDEYIDNEEERDNNYNSNHHNQFIRGSLNEIEEDADNEDVASPLKR